MNDLLDAALGYARLGWPVLPLYTWRNNACTCGHLDCSSPAKHPLSALVPNGLKNATTDLDVIEDWWQRYPAANVGLRTGEVFDALDVDGIEGDRSIRALLEVHGTLPVGPTAETGGGGQHLLFKPTGVTNRAGFVNKVDWRGQKGYIVAAPSLHASGRRYDWIDPPETPLESAPEWLRTILDPPKPERVERPLGERSSVTYLAVPGQGTRYGIAALEAETDELSHAAEGTRNHALNAHAFNLYQLVAGGELDESFTTGRLQDAAIGLGLHGREIEGTLRSARAGGFSNPRYAPALPPRLAATGTDGEGRAIPNEEPEPAPDEAYDSAPEAVTLGSFFVDWTTFWAHDRRDAEWLYPDVLARGRGHSLFAGHKSGKSLLTLYLVTQLVTRLLADGVVVIYLDYEMGEDDLYDRLEEMGHGPNTDFSRLKYALLPSLPPLDKPEGAKALLTIVDHVQAEYPDSHIAVIIDTMARAVVGEENSADTYRDFYRWTGLGLKQRGLTWARLDHAGKDASKGQRGSSSKGDDVDVVWKLTRTENGLELKREASRMNWVPEKVTFRKQQDPYLRFTKVEGDWPSGTKETSVLLDSLGLPLDITDRALGQQFREAGHTCSQQVLRAAQKWRKHIAEGGM